MFRNLVERLNCVIVVLRPDRTVAYLNPFAEQFTGYSAEEMAGRDLLELLIPESTRTDVARHFQAAAEGSEVTEIEHLLITKKAPIRWVLSSLQPIRDERADSAVLLMSQDVTVHRHAERELRRRTHDLGERIKELNCLFGLSKLVEDAPTDVDRICADLVEILPPSWQYPDHTCARVTFRGREFRTYNFRETRWCQSAPIEVYGQPAGTIEVCYLEQKPEAHEGPFLAEERRLINALAERMGRIAEREQIEKEIVNISTREQQRIGQELHDGLGQELTGLGYLAQMLYCDLKQRDAPETEAANQLADGLEKALEQSRTIARGLVPVEIDADGLLSSLEQLAAQTEQRFGIACRFYCDTPALIDDTATAAQMFRIVREAVHNAAKHAQASRITIEAQNHGDTLVFRVRDDGKGIPARTADSDGMGFHIMHHRAGVIGAMLSVGPADGGGTLVTCTIPQNRDHGNR